MKKLIVIILAISAGTTLFAQDSITQHPISKADRRTEKRQRINAIIRQEEEGNLSFTKQTAFGLQLRTDGYGAFLELGKRVSQRYTNLYTAEITEIKQRKEEKSGNPQSFFSNSYVLGKINNFYQVKLGFGKQYILGQKGNKNGVALTASLQGGIDIGLLKPYYLQVQDANQEDKTVSYYSDSAAFISPRFIYGGGGFTKGWNELKIKPGLFIKTALRFDFGRYNENVQALEIGMSLEAFSQKIPILLYNKQQQLFFQGHVAYVFGRRKK